jgi:hypothetical protein
MGHACSCVANVDVTIDLDEFKVAQIIAWAIQRVVWGIEGDFGCFHQGQLYVHYQIRTIYYCSNYCSNYVLLQ